MTKPTSHTDQTPRDKALELLSMHGEQGARDLALLNQITEHRTFWFAVETELDKELQFRKHQQHRAERFGQRV